MEAIPESPQAEPAGGTGVSEGEEHGEKATTSSQGSKYYENYRARRNKEIEHQRARSRGASIICVLLLSPCCVY